MFKPIKKNHSKPRQRYRKRKKKSLERKYLSKGKEID